MTPTAMLLPRAFTGERSRLLSMDLIRSHALDRLYERREAVQNLIRALEDYQKSRKTRLARSAEALRAGLRTMQPGLLGPHPDIL
ncbi:MAG: hypothetical protein ABSF62_16570 [Bryobacteraceae bacterium]